MYPLGAGAMGFSVETFDHFAAQGIEIIRRIGIVQHHAGGIVDHGEHCPSDKGGKEHSQKSGNEVETLKIHCIFVGEN